MRANEVIRVEFVLYPNSGVVLDQVPGIAEAGKFRSTALSSASWFLRVLKSFGFAVSENFFDAC